MRKKVDSRVRILIENAVAQRHRAFFVMVGDRGKDQVVNLHYMLSKATTRKPSVLWCYKHDLGFSSHRKKRMKQLKKKIQSGLFDPNIDDPFELFVSSTRIRYCYYKETHTILGQTFSMCILQDFEALTPNILCRTIETVEGGGIVCLLLRAMSSLKQLYTLTMDVHARLTTHNQMFSGGLGAVEPRFNERLILSLADCKNCLVVDDELNILPLSRHAKDIVPVSDRHATVLAGTTGPNKKALTTAFEYSGWSETPELRELKESLASSTPVVKALVDLAVTLDQANVLLSFVNTISEKVLNATLALSAGRGRGKSATLGLALAAALAHGYSNLFVTAPSPENVKTLFDFVQKGLVALGYQEHLDFELVEGEVVTGTASARHLVRINVFKEHRQTVQYITPTDVPFARQSEILIIDEAAAIPLPVVKKLFGPYLVFLSSTIHGYEGTGRALSLKLLKDIKSGVLQGKAAVTGGRSLKELKLEEPIRYGPEDPVEAWLNQLLCLHATEAFPLDSKSFPLPSSCQLYQVNRDALFSYHSVSEALLKKIVSLFVTSHYKNSPNDLILLSDSPAQLLFVLLPPLSDTSTTVADVFVAIQVSLEGSISKDAIKAALEKGLRPSGDLIPWTLSQTFIDEEFGSLNGARIVRIAVHPSVQKMGYGTEALRQLEAFLRGEGGDLDLLLDIEAKKSTITEDKSSDDKTSGEASDGRQPESDEASLQTEILRVKATPPLLAPCSETKLPMTIHYLGTAFGLTAELLRFHQRLGFLPVYLRQTLNDITGEHSVIMVRPLDGGTWVHAFYEDFRNRFVNLLASAFSDIPLGVALSLVTHKKESSSSQTLSLAMPPVTHETVLQFFSHHDLRRLERYSQQLIERSLILDLLPIVSWLLFTERMKDIGLTALQRAVVLGLGSQRRTVDAIAAEFDIPVNQVLSLFNKAMHKLHKYFQELMESGIEAEETANGKVSTQLALPTELPSKSLNEELEENAEVITTQHFKTPKGLERYALERLDLDELHKAVQGNIPATGTVSIKRRADDRHENLGFSLKQATKRTKKGSH